MRNSSCQQFNSNTNKPIVKQEMTGGWSANVSSSTSAAPQLNEQDLALLIAAANRPGRRINERELSDDEKTKLLLRRERNKQAAARCRNRRRDLTMTLQAQTDELEDVRNNLESEISELEKQKEQLEFILEVHKPVCKLQAAGLSPLLTTPTLPFAATTPSSDNFSFSLDNMVDSILMTPTTTHAPLLVTSSAADTLITSPTTKSLLNL